MYSLKRVSGEELLAWSGFTFPSLGPRLKQQEMWPHFVAVSADVLGTPAGLVLAELTDNPQAAIIQSIAVARQYRRLGIASALLQAVEIDLLNRGCTSVAVTYVAKHPPTITLDGLLKNNGWPALQPGGMFYRSDYETLSKAPWMKHRNLPAHLQVFFWRDVTPEDRMDVRKRQEQTPWFPEVLDPFDHEERLEPTSSLGLKHNGRIVGWCIIHKVNSSTTECASLFVSKEFQARGHALALLVRAISLHRDMKEHNFIFDVAFTKTDMMKFVQRRMVDHLTSMCVVNRSTKQLGIDPAALKASA
jgi:GNAT superfamily N-acetyltransferase